LVSFDRQRAFCRVSFVVGAIAFPASRFQRALRTIYARLYMQPRYSCCTIQDRALRTIYARSQDTRVVPSKIGCARFVPSNSKCYHCVCIKSLPFHGLCSGSVPSRIARSESACDLVQELEGATRIGRIRPTHHQQRKTRKKREQQRKVRPPNHRKTQQLAKSSIIVARNEPPTATLPQLSPAPPNARQTQVTALFPSPLYKENTSDCPTHLNFLPPSGKATQAALPHTTPQERAKTNKIEFRTQINLCQSPMLLLMAVSVSVCRQRRLRRQPEYHFTQIKSTGNVISSPCDMHAPHLDVRGRSRQR